MGSLILESLHLLFLLSLASVFSPAMSRSRLHLRRGESISVGKESDFLTSPDNSFTCGFYGLGTNAVWFAIWFTNSMDKTVIWMANRNKPVNIKGAKATIRRDGTIVLTDVDETVVWQTDTTTTDVTVAELLKTGNLVLKNPQGTILWQSFDFPTDTLLPSQAFTKSTRLTSVSTKGSFASGIFNLYFGSDNVLSAFLQDSYDLSFPEYKWATLI